MIRRFVTSIVESQITTLLIDGFHFFISFQHVGGLLLVLTYDRVGKKRFSLLVSLIPVPLVNFGF